MSDSPGRMEVREIPDKYRHHGVTGDNWELWINDKLRATCHSPATARRLAACWNDHDYLMTVAAASVEDDEETEAAVAALVEVAEQQAEEDCHCPGETEPCIPCQARAALALAGRGSE